MYIDGFEEYESEAQYIRRQKEIYDRYGLAIFESFEEYMEDKMEQFEH